MKPFQLLCKPTAGDCNLACTYCFYRETTPHLYPDEIKHRMSPEIMEAMVKDLLSHRFPETIFCWQGGEPTLMGLSFFEAVIEAQMKHGKGGQVVGNAFQTNGILINDDWARFFARYQMVVGLSLDGPREVHDHFRQNAGGAGTFERVMEAAELLHARGVAFNILCVVNRMNQERGREVYRFFRAHGFDYIQFIPCLETGPDGSVMPFSATPDGLARFQGDVFDEYRRDGFPAVSERTFDAVLNLHLSGRPNVCTFGERCGEYLVVEYNGDVYPCDFFVEREWRLGNVMDRGLAEFFSHPLMKTFAARKQEVADECRECGRLSWCHGGCLKDRLPDRASAPGRTYFCESYQALFDATDKDMAQWADEIRAQQAAEQSRVQPAARIPGRNDPCPCGSDKKFKKCCGRES
ncbi:MAG TPA: anaerobic sulfatase maturase [bacterium]|nr:anaerobic sulfatase maturase [bacterium]